MKCLRRSVFGQWPAMAKNPHAVALGRLGGRVKSEKKTQAVRENAKKPRRKRKEQTDG